MILKGIVEKYVTVVMMMIMIYYTGNVEKKIIHFYGFFELKW